MSTITMPRPTDLFQRRIDEPKNRTIETHHLQPQGLRQEDLNKVDDLKPVNLIIDGAFAAIHRRLIGPGLDAVRKALDAIGIKLPLSIVAVDKFERDQEYSFFDQGTKQYANKPGQEIIDEQLRILSASTESGGTGLPLHEQVPYLSRADLEKALQESNSGTLNLPGGGEMKVDRAIVTTRSMEHLPSIQRFADAGIPTITEKPWVPTRNGQVDQLEGLIKKHGADSVAGTDFFPYGDSVSILQEHPEILEGLGKLKAVHAVCSEPGGIESGRDWLLDMNQSGAGLMDDQIPHPASMVDLVLTRHFGAGLEEAQIQDVKTARLKNPFGDKALETELNTRHPENKDLETAGTISAKVNVPKQGNVDVILSFGKGIGGRPGGHLAGKKANTDDEQVSYGMELMFENGRVELSTGADNNFKPYVVRTPNNPSESITVYEVEGGKLGYSQMVLDWILKAQGNISETFIQVSRSALNAIRLLSKAHKFIHEHGIKPVPYQLGQMLSFEFAQAFTNPLIETQSVGNHEANWDSHKATGVQ